MPRHESTSQRGVMGLYDDGGTHICVDSGGGRGTQIWQSLIGEGIKICGNQILNTGQSLIQGHDVLGIFGFEVTLTPGRNLTQSS